MTSLVWMCPWCLPVPSLHLSIVSLYLPCWAVGIDTVSTLFPGSGTDMHPISSPPSAPWPSQFMCSPFLSRASPGLCFLRSCQPSCSVLDSPAPSTISYLVGPVHFADGFLSQPSCISGAVEGPERERPRFLTTQQTLAQLEDLTHQCCLPLISWYEASTYSKELLSFPPTSLLYHSLSRSFNSGGIYLKFGQSLVRSYFTLLFLPFSVLKDFTV